MAADVDENVIPAKAGIQLFMSFSGFPPSRE